ncbi:uncharacterized protein METZ01_LOCUS501137, partial [marine metagenome]
MQNFGCVQGNTAMQFWNYSTFELLKNSVFIYELEA